MLFFYDKKIEIWDVEAREVIKVLQDKSSGPEDTFFSQNNQFIATRTGYPSLEVWNVDTGNLVQRLQIDNVSKYQYLQIDDSGEVYVDEYAESFLSDVVTFLPSIRFSENNNALYSVFLRSRFFHKERTYEACVYRFQENTVCHIRDHFLLYDNHGQVYSLIERDYGIFELREGLDDDGLLLTTVRTGMYIHEPIITADKRFLIYQSREDTPGSGTTDVWDIKEQKRVHRWRENADKPIVSPDGRYLAFIFNKQEGFRIFGNHLLVYDLNENRVVYREEPKYTFNSGIAFSWDSTHLVYATIIKSDYQKDVITTQVRLLNLETKKSAELFSVERSWESRNDFSALAFSPHGDLLVSADHDGIIRFYGLPDGELNYEWSAPGERGRIIFSTDRRYIALASSSLTREGFIRVWGVLP